MLPLQERDDASARLAKELERSKGGTPRSTYTDRIMDIARNLRKQKVEIERILTDIRESQKEVNALSETLQRSFAAADEVRSTYYDCTTVLTDWLAGWLTYLGDLPRRYPRHNLFTT